MATKFWSIYSEKGSGEKGNVCEISKKKFKRQSSKFRPATNNKTPIQISISFQKLQ